MIEDIYIFNFNKLNKHEHVELYDIKTLDNNNMLLNYNELLNELNEIDNLFKQCDSVGTDITANAPVINNELNMVSFLNKNELNSVFLQDTIIDTNISINQNIMKKIMTQLGITSITIANNGKEALDDKIYDIIFMDIQMPIMNGLEATHTLKKTNINNVIIGCTGNSTSNDIQKCVNSGMDYIIIKPVDIYKIFEAIYKFYNYGKIPLNIKHPFYIL
jgi:CheY-like chemotaxis protein